MMRSKKYKDLSKLYRRLYGEFHYRTIYCNCRKNIIFAPFVLVLTFLKPLRYGVKWLLKENRKREIKNAYSQFIGAHERMSSELIKPIALYLPQFHAIPENDEWWGKGFTEWTNVKKAKPLFEGHYQPHVPHPDIGYYDLSDVNVMRRQAEMAKAYGIYGFCFYYYHFANGKRLLEKPLDNWLKATDIDFPFCYAWANENWTRAWDGGDKEIICEQSYDELNMVQMLRDMILAFKDKRYIRVGNRPVLLVYRAELIPQIKSLTARWRSLIKDAGFEGLYLIAMQNFEENDPRKMGFDAAVEFAPKVDARACAHVDRNLIDAVLGNKGIFCQSMKNVVSEMSFRKKVDYPRIKCVCPSWDNTPRKGENKPRFFVHSSPGLFYSFLKNAVQETIANNFPCDGMLFINAWNEWGEGAHLEPDEKFGYGFLEVVKSCMECSGT